MSDWWLSSRTRAAEWLVRHDWLPGFLWVPLMKHLFHLWAVQHRKEMRRRHGTETPQLRAKR